MRKVTAKTRRNTAPELVRLHPKWYNYFFSFDISHNQAISINNKTCTGPLVQYHKTLNALSGFINLLESK